MTVSDPYRARRRMPNLPEREPLDDRPPRVLAHVHLYPPGHNAGAEVMLHTMLRHLQADGWDAQVIAMQYRGRPYEWDGIPVEATPIDADLPRFYGWADVVVTHLDATRSAMAWARRGRPLVHLVHNHRQLAHHKVTPAGAQLVVWNSRWVEREHGMWTGDTMIVRPPVNSRDYATGNFRRYERGTVTLLNLAEAKGGPLFWRLARKRPDLRFVGVRGAYAAQHEPPAGLANVTVLDHGPDVLSIYRDTRVLAVPSSYESWGRVAVEAMASGIPVVAHPTPGLLEALTLADGTPAALFADRDSDQAWLAALSRLDDLGEWRRFAELARRRSAELDQVGAQDLAAFAAAMRRLATEPVPAGRVLGL